MKKRELLLLAVCALTGCLTASHHERAFTRDWAERAEKEEAFQKRKARLEGEDKGKKGLIRSGSGPEGNPRVGLGKDEGLSADVGSGGGAVKYGFKW